MISAAIFLAAAALAGGDDPAIDCDNQMAQRDMNICSYRDYEQADQDLNTQWKITSEIQKRFDRDPYVVKDGRPGYFDTLLAAQRAWLTYRDNHCRSEGYSMRGGTAEPLVNNGCRAQLTRARTEQLKDLAEEK
ncbi:MAG TPA: lysozyme inhibitor LprI family protein [Sphingopyxis sp.]|nr:lysozyme inhibitor LprI family protein [Sphingopyxis sp.]